MSRKDQMHEQGETTERLAETVLKGRDRRFECDQAFLSMDRANTEA
ncbi:MAG: hypothetical protein HQ488_03650 [Parcubacteria group bacterium]|nr:hypothetical protein [Parcubacteria group bacterium]